VEHISNAIKKFLAVQIETKEKDSMAIYARKKEGEYTVAPEGLWPAVCCDVYDLGIVKTQFGDQVKIEITWQLEEKDPQTGKRFLISQRYTPSLHEKSRLRPLLESWRGRKFTKDEEKEFDIEKLLGANCQLQLVHNIKDEGRTYANVQACVPYPKNVPRISVEGYIRKVDREKNYENHPDGQTEDDSYIPF
jgi:hypothetical protein